MVTMPSASAGGSTLTEIEAGIPTPRARRIASFPSSVLIETLVTPAAGARTTVEESAISPTPCGVIATPAPWSWKRM